MNRSFITVVTAVVVLAGTLGAQAITVVGTGDPSLDIPAVQSAVDQGGRVILKGHFSFDAPPTVPEKGGGFGTILVSKSVVIAGAFDDQGEMARVEGGTNPLYVEAPGAHITIQGLHLVNAKNYAIHVTAASGLLIASNRIEGVLRGDAIFAAGIYIDSSQSFTLASEAVSGTLLIVNNDIDVQGTAGFPFLGIEALGVGISPDHEADLYISRNNFKNSTERPINIYNVGGRAYLERNVITTGDGPGINVTPSGDVIHIVGTGSFLIAHNVIDCQWSSGRQAGIRLQTNPGYAVVMDNDVNMLAPEDTQFSATSAAIEVRGAGQGNMVLNNRIRGRANFALSVANQNGSPQNTAFIMNDLSQFTSAGSDIFVDAGATKTIAVGVQSTVEDQGSGTLIVPTPRP
jgi:hypothetical protein